MQKRHTYIIIHTEHNFTTALIRWFRFFYSGYSNYIALTSIAVSQLIADDNSISIGPTLIRYLTPNIIETRLYRSFIDKVPAHQTNVTIFTSYDMTNKDAQ